MMRGGALGYAAQAISPINAEIAEKGHLRPESKLHSHECML